MKLEPIIQSEVSQKEKHQYNIMGTPAKPSGESLTPFQSLNGQISGYPLPRVSISFFPFTAHLQSYGIVGPGFRKKGVVSES